MSQKPVWLKGFPLELTPTGIRGLDEVIGGFIRGRTYLVSGETGTGKTIFSLSFLVNGVNRGETGVYVLVDENLEDFLAGAKSFGWHLDKAIEQERISVMTILPEFIERFKDKTIEATAKSIVRDIKNEVKRLDAKRLVIDPVVPLISEENTIKIREYIRLLIQLLEREIGTTTIITSEIPTGSMALSRFGVEEFLASGIIVLGLKKTLRGYTRTLFIRKMRWIPVYPAVYRFEMVPGQGIVVKERME
ncbi:MAG: ATPase domain-containing protein [Candidatus Baldrarchaeota archaeon]